MNPFQSGAVFMLGVVFAILMAWLGAFNENSAVCVAAGYERGPVMFWTSHPGCTRVDLDGRRQEFVPYAELRP